MATISRWLTWTPVEQKFSRMSEREPSKPPKTIFEGFGGSNSGKIQNFLGAMLEDPADWLPEFEKWVLVECTFRDETWGNIKFLHKRFCAWCDSHQSVSCSLRTFESMLREQFRFLLDQGFWTEAEMGNGSIYGVVLAEDFKVGCVAHPDVLAGDKDGFGFGIVDTRRSPPAGQSQPGIPDGAYRVVSRTRVAGPVRISECEVVHDAEKFIPFALRELEAALAGKAWQSSNRSIPDLIDRLRLCGVVVEITDERKP